MSYGQSEGLDFNEFRRANVARQVAFRNGRGETINFGADGSKWDLCQWMTALVGEVGEAANIIKKIELGDYTLNEKRQDLADELADVQTYLDLLANRAGIDLGEATRRKFNIVSDRVGSTVRL